MSQAADIVIARGQDLTGALYRSGPLSVTSGDFDQDGRIDLAIGEPTSSLLLRTGSTHSTLQTSTKGRLEVFTAVAHAGRELSLYSDSQFSLTGVSNGDQFGWLPTTPNLDFNLDGVDDLLIGAPGVDAAFTDSGRIYALPGRSYATINPTDIVAKPLSNQTIGGTGFVAASGISSFSGGELSDSPGAEDWYRFRLLSVGGVDDFVQVFSPDALVAANNRLVFDLFDASGRPVALRRSTFDMRGESAGEYYLRVYDVGPPGWRSSSLSYDVRIATSLTPSDESNTPYVDRDAIAGGAGNDTLIGNQGLDRIRAGSGINRIVAETTEVMDLDSALTTISPPLDADLSSRYSFDPDNDVINIDDPHLLLSIKNSLNIPNEVKTTLTERDLASLTYFGTLVGDDFGNPADIWPFVTYAKNALIVELIQAESPLAGTYDASGLGQLTELRRLGLFGAGNLGSFDFMSNLTKLQELTLGNTNFTNAALLPATMKKLLIAAPTVGFDMSSLNGRLPSLTNLAELTLRSFDLSQLDLALVAALPNIAELTLVAGSLADISDLSGAASIRQLNLSNNLLTDIEVLLTLPNLQSVILTGNSLNNQAYAVVIPELRRRGVSVTHSDDTAPAAIAISNYSKPLLPGVYMGETIHFTGIVRDPNPGNGSNFSYLWRVYDELGQFEGNYSPNADLYFTIPNTSNWAGTDKMFVELTVLDHDQLDGNNNPTQYRSKIELTAFAVPQIVVSYANTGPGLELLAVEDQETSLSISLDRAPLDELFIDVFNGNQYNLTGAIPGFLPTSSSNLRFDEANWNAPQTFSFIAGDDGDIADNLGQLTLSLTRYPGAAFPGLAWRFQSVAIADDDRRILVDGVSESIEVVVDEGSSNSYGITLSGPPTADLTLTITKLFGDDDIATSTSTLTFTPFDWNQPQYITFEGAEDDDVIGGSATFSLDGLLLPDGYSYSQTLTVREQENEVAQILVSTRDVVVGEGDTSSFAVSLSARPTGNVVVNISQAMTGDSDLTANATLVFTPADWSIPQSVVVAAAQDEDATNGTRTLMLNAAGWLPNTVELAEADDDFGFVIDNAFGIDEGRSRLLAVSLAGRPVTNVVVTGVLTGLGSNSFAVDGSSSLAFTPNNWNIPKYFAVRAVEDANGANERAQLQLSASSSVDTSAWATAYTAVGLESSDNDRALVITRQNVIPPLGIPEVLEGSSDQQPFLVSLLAQPDQEVVVNLAWTGGDSDLSIQSPTALIFTPANWDVPQAVTIAAALDSDIDPGIAQFSVAANGWGQQLIDISEKEDGRWIELSTANLVIPEAQQGELRFRLLYSPMEPLLVDIIELIPYTGLQVVGQKTFELNSSNWDIWQTILVEAGADLDLADDVAQFALRAIGQNDTAFAVTQLDNRRAVDASASELVVREGGQASLGVRLITQPQANITVDVVSLSGDSDLMLAAGSPASLTFTPQNWNEYQQLTFSASNDLDSTDGNAILTLRTSDPSLPDLTVQIVELDAARTILVSPLIASERLEIAEGQGATAQVVLASAPTDDLLITVSLSGDDNLSLTGVTTITFTPSNWNLPQFIEVVATDDDDSVSGTSQLIVSAAGWIAGGLSVKEIDDDSAGFDIVLLSTPVVVEGGMHANFSVALTSQPTEVVAIPLSWSVAGQAYASSNQLIFDASNWSVPQAVSIRAIDDWQDENDVTVSLVFEAARSEAYEYAGLQPAPISFTVVDNDVAGLLVSNLQRSVVSEAGTRTEFSVRLSTQPTGDVTVSLTNSDIGEIALSTNQLSFTGENWNVPQVVSLVALDDAIDDGDQTVTIALDVSSSDMLYASLTIDPIRLQNLDNDYTTVNEPVGSVSVEIDGVLYYVATTPEAGQELWMTSGTAAGAVLLSDLSPGPESSRVAELTVFNGKLYFVAESPGSGRELWIHDPVSRQTDLVVDLTSGNAHGNPSRLTVAGTQLFFTTPGSVDQEYQLWSLSPTHQLQALRTFVMDDASQMVAFQGKLLFAADGNDGYGQELWVSDGTALGTGRLSDIRIGRLNSDILELTSSSNRLYFSANDGLHGQELWALDSITSEPYLVKDIRLGVLDSSPHDLVVFGAGVMFAASDEFGDELWLSEGTAASTEMVIDLNPTGDSSPNQLVVIDGNRIFFTAYNELHGRELWESDGTAAGTILREVNPGPSGSDPFNLTVVGSALYFAAYDSIHGYELWRSTSPPVLVSDVNSSSSSLPKVLGSVSGQTLFTAEQDSGERRIFRTSGPGLVNELAKAGVILTSMGSNLTEGGNSITYNLRLTSQPTADVVIQLNVDTAQVTLSASTVTFTPLDWDQDQQITITAVDNLIAESTLTIDIEHSLSSLDSVYAQVGKVRLPIELADDDVAGIAVSGLTSLQTSELGNSSEFNVVLTSQPTADVSFLMVSTDTTEAALSSFLIVFTPANWNIPQTVTISGLDDSIQDGDQIYQVLTSASSSYDEFYNELFLPDFELANLDNEGLPTVSIADVVVAEPVVGSLQVEFIVTLDHASRFTVEVDYSTADGTAQIAAGDYLSTSGRLQFAPGELQRSILVTINTDLVAEPDEQFFVNLFNVQAGTLGDFQAIGTIEANIVVQDVTRPVSSIAALPTDALDLVIPITVSGYDPAGPTGSQVSGIKEFRIYVSVDGGAFQLYQTLDANSPNTHYLAQSDHIYFFRSIAVDFAGNAEIKSTVDAKTTVGDFDPPSTSVVSAVANTAGLFTVNATGTDSGGGNLIFVDYYVSVDGGVAQLIGTAGAGAPDSEGIYRTSISFQGITDGASHRYRFFSIGRDSASNIESAPGRTNDVTVIATFQNVGLVATGIDVQLGSRQRSYIRHLDVLFSSEAGLSDLLANGRVVVERFDMGSTNVAPGQGTPIAASNMTKVGDRLRLDFGASGIAGSASSAVGDGLYRVRIDVNGDGDFSDSIDGQFEFFRLLGDANGDGRVGADDYDVVLNQLDQAGGNLDGDVNGSQYVDFDDYFIVDDQQGREIDPNWRPLLDD